MLLLRRCILRGTLFMKKLRVSGLLRMKVLQPAISAYSPFQLHTEDIKNNLAARALAVTMVMWSRAGDWGVCPCLILEPSAMSAWLVFMLTIFLPTFFLLPAESLKNTQNLFRSRSNHWVFSPSDKRLLENKD